MRRRVDCFLLGQTLPAIWPRPFNPDDVQTEGLKTANRTAKEEYQRRLDGVTPSGVTRTHTFEQIRANLTLHHNRSLLSVIDAIQRNQPLPVAPKVWEYAVVIGNRLRQLKVTSGDLRRLRDWVGSGDWHKSSDLIAFTGLWAGIEQAGLRTNRRPNANDMLDILRLAVAFADAQAVFCDKHMASSIQQAKLDKELPGLQVFGWRDIRAAIAYISAQ